MPGVLHLRQVELDIWVKCRLCFIPTPIHQHRIILLHRSFGIHDFIKCIVCIVQVNLICALKLLKLLLACIYAQTTFEEAAGLLPLLCDLRQQL